MVNALRSLEIAIDTDWPSTTLTVNGCASKIPSRGAELNLEGSGTSLRFLTALVATGNGVFTLDGNSRMRQRPIAELADALRQCDTEINSTSGFPPLMVRANKLSGASVSLNGDISSQYLSALLLAAPAATGAMEFQIQGPQVSQPYISMTCAVMDAFGVHVKREEAVRFFVEPKWPTIQLQA